VNRLSAHDEVRHPRDVRDDRTTADRVHRNPQLRDGRVVDLFEGGIQMEREADHGRRQRSIGAGIRDRRIGEVARGQIERPAAVVRAARSNDRSGGPVRVKVDFLVEGIDAVEVIAEPARRAVIETAVIGDAVRVPVSEFDDRIEFDRVEGIDLDGAVLRNGTVLRITTWATPRYRALIATR